MNLAHSFTLFNDAYGRHLFPLLLKAGLRSVAISFLVLFLCDFITLLFSFFYSFTSRKTRPFLQACLDPLILFPPLLLGLTVSLFLKQSYPSLLLCLLVDLLPSQLRLFSAFLEKELGRTHIESARALGSTPFEVFQAHLFPETLRLFLLKFPNQFIHVIMAESTLSFLGLGAPAGTDTLGTLLSQGKDFLLEAPHIALLSGVPLFLILIGLQFTSERFRRKASG